jgi:hypothetical protein
MRQRTRKLLGVPLLVAILVAWVALAVFVFESWIDGGPAWAVLIYFALAGLGWFFPAALAVRWMQSPD